MSTLRWSGFGSFVVDERERFHVDFDDVYGGFTLTHELGRGSSHSVGHVGKHQSLAAVEEAAVAHAAKAAGGGRACYLGDQEAHP